MKTWVDNEKRLMREFSQLVEEKSKLYMPLKHIFLKNGTLESINYSSSSVNNVTIDGNIPPDGCDDKLHAHVLQLRDKRMHQVKGLERMQNDIKILKAKYDNCLSIERVVAEKLNKVETELTEFRKRTFQMLSDQYVPTFINIDRIHEDQNHLESHDAKTGHTNTAKKSESRTLKLAPNRQSSTGETENIDYIIISQKDFSNLERRLPLLQDEVKYDKSELRRIQRDISKLEKQISTKETTLKEQKERSRELQMLKFGQLIDMNAVDNIQSANIEAELEAEMNQLSKECNRSIAVAQMRQTELKEQYLSVTNENTLILKEIAQVKARQLFLKRETQREKENKNNEGNAGAQNRKSICDFEEERKQLQSLVNVQSERITNLNAEIKKLNRKNGTYAYSGIIFSSVDINSSPIAPIIYIVEGKTQNHLLHACCSGHIDISAIQLLQSEL